MNIECPRCHFTIPAGPRTTRLGSLARYDALHCPECASNWWAYFDDDGKPSRLEEMEMVDDIPSPRGNSTGYRSSGWREVFTLTVDDPDWDHPATG